MSNNQPPIELGDTERGSADFRSGQGHIQPKEPLYGYRLDVPTLKLLHRQLREIVKKDADNQLARLSKLPDQTDEQFMSRKKYLRDQAYAVYIRIEYSNYTREFSSSSDILDTLTGIVSAVNITNITPMREVINRDPLNAFEINIDFSKTPVFDWSVSPSVRTENNSYSTVTALDRGFYTSFRSIIDDLQPNKMAYRALHGSLIYDIFLWIVAVPAIIFYCNKASIILSDWAVTEFAVRTIAIFYVAFVGLIVVRTTFSYLRWAFPVNVFAPNKDRPAIHRAIIAFLLASIILPVAIGLLTGSG